jgi:hypothetical protein
MAVELLDPAFMQGCDETGLKIIGQGAVTALLGGEYQLTGDSPAILAS